MGIFSDMKVFLLDDIVEGKMMGKAACSRKGLVLLNNGKQRTYVQTDYMEM